MSAIAGIFWHTTISGGLRRSVVTSRRPATSIYAGDRKLRGGDGTTSGIRVIDLRTKAVRVIVRHCLGDDALWLADAAL